MGRRKTDRTLTAGDVARMANVAHKTAVKWCDSGLLPSHRLPQGRRERRVAVGDLVAFLEKHGIPVPDCLRREG